MKQHDEVWVLLYLHDWDPVREDGSQPIYPECHGFYETWQEAEAMKKLKIHPERYWVRRANNRTGKGF